MRFCNYHRLRGAGWVGWVLGCGLFFVPAARAHDPLEITATIYLRSNHLEFNAEMEGRPARLLAKAPEGSGAEEMLTRLEARASSLFRVGSGGTLLTPTSITVMPGQEDHVRLRLLFPVPGRGPLKVEAPLLTELSDAGGYGVSLTVLDMVNQKVVEQSVLLADQMAATFDDVEAAGPARESGVGGTDRKATAVGQAGPGPADQHSAPNENGGGRRRWAVTGLVLALAGIGLAWRWQTRRA